MRLVSYPARAEGLGKYDKTRGNKSENTGERRLKR